MKIDIHPTYAIVDDNVAVKTIKLEHVIKAFSSVKTSMESPLLPVNCIKYKESGNTISVFLYHPETRFNATVYSTLYESCIRPSIIMKYTLSRKGESYLMQSSFCYGVSDPFIAINNKTSLLGLPFPNIGSSGSICWGSNGYGGQFTSLIGLSTYIDRLFNSPFNNHLTNFELLKRSHNISTVEQLFSYLQTLEQWDNSLFEQNTGYTLGGI